MRQSRVCTKWHVLLPLESLVKFLLSSSSAVSMEKLSSPKGFQDGWSRALRLEAAVVIRPGTEGAFRLGAEEAARLWAEVVTRFGTEAVAPHCWPDSYTLCWEDCGELDGVALADLRGVRAETHERLISISYSNMYVRGSRDVVRTP